MFLTAFPDNAQAFLNSGITVGSVAAILLNLLLNHWGGATDAERVDDVLRSPSPSSTR